MELASRKNLLPSTPYRMRRPSSDKIIFLSCEGAVTEEEYFDMIKNIFSEVKSKIQFVSVMEEVVNTPPKFRSQEQNLQISKSQPKQLVEKIDKFKVKYNSDYEFDKHPEDEFWIIADVDDHTDENHIEDWNEAIATCEAKGYGYAISNPFFEFWLLIHHVEVIEEDETYAVTKEHPYEKTEHFRTRLSNAGAPMTGKNEKHILKEHYDIDKVKKATERAKALYNTEEKWPSKLGTTVYILLQKIQEIFASQINEVRTEG